MQLDKDSGLLIGVRCLPSPNYNQRPPGTSVSAVIIHSITLPKTAIGSSAIDQLFCNCIDPASYPFFKDCVDIRVSAHLLINRVGELTQYVSFNHRAWHAGVSCLEGRSNCNDFSIGIELEALAEKEYTNQQYVNLVDTIVLLQQAYPAITLQRIVGHADIAPDRKTDPGALFDWSYLHQLMRIRLP